MPGVIYFMILSFSLSCKKRIFLRNLLSVHHILAGERGPLPYSHEIVCVVDGNSSCINGFPLSLAEKFAKKILELVAQNGRLMMNL